MPNGGELEIRTRYVTLAGGVTGIRAGDYVEITVRDTGHGIPAEVLPRIFDPFFSTKGQDRGTGLGLSVAYGIMRQHEGHIHAVSEVAFGTTFTLLLPRVPAPRHQPSTGSGPTTLTARGTETILVVEDEPLVNELTVHILEEAGYRVLSAKDGVEACEIFQTKSAQISMVLMDVIMPRMGGREAAQRIRNQRPDIALLFCSGYSGPALELSQALPRNQAVLSKPYRPSDLLKRVRESLDARKATVAN
jgi:CheY-like chemotaxis protein